MKTIRIKSFLILGAFLAYIFSPEISLLGFVKKYSYDSDIKELSGKISTKYQKESSLINLKPKFETYSMDGTVNFSVNADMIVFAYKNNGLTPPKFYIISNGKKIPVNIDEDGDERILSDKMRYTIPFFADPKKKYSYSIESDNLNQLKQTVAIGLDTQSYNETVTFGNITNVNANIDSNIVSRSEWGADETLRYKDNPKWVAIYKKLEQSESQPKTDWEIKQEQKIINIREYLSKNFPLEDTPVNTITKEGTHELVWPIEKTKRVEKIVIHHTAETLTDDARDDATIIRGIYYYHTITKGWGDIGYNYLIGRDGKIYEGRAGGDYVVAAHNLWNNKSTVGVSVMGNFQDSDIGASQRSGLELALSILTKKYGINSVGTSISHKECTTSENCLLKDYDAPNISGHRDAGSTNCPGINLYSKIPSFRDSIKEYTKNLSYIENKEVYTSSPTLSKGPNIKVRLSYTGSTVDIKSYTNESMKIEIGSRSGYTKLSSMHFETRGTGSIALVLGSKYLKISSIKISSKVLEIPSWERKLSWDSTGKINDNKFRGSITIFNDNGKLTLVNELPLEDYLKGIGEISNTENDEKSKTILVSARSYALWYTKPENRKFPGKPYDGSDNPDEFQKYLGYSFEMRSSNIARLVDETNGIVIKYNGNLIKPWYFSQSNGKTKSYKEYCEKRKLEGSFPVTMTCEDIPYLQSVSDPGGDSVVGYKGHGVGISGAGSKYLSEFENKKYDEIIKYFLKGVTVEKITY